MSDKLHRLNAFIVAREAHQDWHLFFSRDNTMLHRQMLCESCGFPRSTLYQNTTIKLRLQSLEAELRQRKILVFPDNSFHENGIELTTDPNLEQRIETLRLRLQALSTRLGEIDAYLLSFHPDTILEVLR